MRSTCKPSAGLWLASMAAALPAGCGIQQQGVDAGSLPFDARPAEPNEVPYAEGVGGTLAYRNGCLFITSPGGGETGLVMPDTFELTGHVLSNGHVSYRLGEQVSFSAGFVSPEHTRERNCRTGAVAMVVNSFPTKPPAEPYPQEP